MAEINKAPRGTADVLPEDSYKWQYVEKTMLETAELYGYKEVRTPVFEHTEVFLRSVGDTTDVVQKEMYTFNDKGNRSITLRPEITAGTVRSMIEHGNICGTLPVKTCYVGSCYRYEKPQAGRLREFHQFGVECFGTADASADAEIILLANNVLNNLGIKDLSLEINSIGCPQCRAKYHKALIEYFNNKKSDLCGTCAERLERNPMRIFDCKSPVCSEICKDAPTILEYLCNDCKEHFELVKKHLTAADISYTINPKIVRGLDYYTRTVFEFVSGSIGAQSTVCGGGRYDGLVSQMGGAHTPSLGFAMGIERLLLVMENQNTEFPKPATCDLYIGAMDNDARIYGTKLAQMLRVEGFSVETDIVSRSVKAQMKYANKISAKFSVIIGENELSSKTAVLKNMQTGEQIETSLPDGLISAIYGAQVNCAMDNLTDSIGDLDSALSTLK